ncbi:MAG TPA: hypothetical protein VGF45_14820 [Polyangia bacterium]
MTDPNAKRGPTSPTVAPCPSFLALARWEASGTGDIADHVAGCARCTDRLADLRTDREVLLGSAPTENARRAAREILATSHAAGTRESLWEVLRRRAGIVLPAFAAVGLLAIFLQRAPLPTAPAIDADRTAERAKGALLFEMYRQREPNGPVEIARDGDQYQPGDRLRFEYSTSAPGYLFVVGVDDTGAVFPYYPDDSSPGIPVKIARRAMLSDSIELDGHRGTERIFALWSPRPIPGATVQSAVAEALRAAGGELEKIERLPIDADQATRLLRRP